MFWLLPYLIAGLILFLTYKGISKTYNYEENSVKTLKFTVAIFTVFFILFILNRDFISFIIILSSGYNIYRLREVLHDDTKDKMEAMDYLSEIFKEIKDVAKITYLEIINIFKKTSDSVDKDKIKSLSSKINVRKGGTRMNVNVKPITKKGQIKKFGFFQSLPELKPNTCIVYRGPQGGYTEVTEDNPIKKSEAITKYKEYFVVDLNTYKLTYNKEFRDKSAVDNFATEIELKFNVCNPTAIVKNNCLNANEIIEDYLFRKLKNMALEYYQDEKEQFMNEVRKESLIHEINEELKEEGFEISLLDIAVILTAEEREKIESKRQVEDKIEKMKDDYAIKEAAQTLEEKYTTEGMDKVRRMIENNDMAGLAIFAATEPKMFNAIMAAIEKMKIMEKENIESVINIVDNLNKKGIRDERILNKVLPGGKEMLESNKEPVMLDEKKLEALAEDDE